MKMGSDESHFNVSLILGGWKVARSVHKQLSRERRVGVGNQTHVIHLPAQDAQADMEKQGNFC